MSDAEPRNETPFWRFSLQFYRQPGVADACIALQDGGGVDVNLLLFVLWLASAGRQLSADEVKKLDDLVRDWRDLTIIPIRDARRKLKAARTLIERGKQEAFRTRIKAIELEAERLQQEALYAVALSGAPGFAADPRTAARAGVAAYEDVLGASFAKAAVDALLGAFDTIKNAEFSAAPAAQ